MHRQLVGHPVAISHNTYLPVDVLREGKTGGASRCTMQRSLSFGTRLSNIFHNMLQNERITRLSLAAFRWELL
jgi:hypothetical protein